MTSTYVSFLAGHLSAFVALRRSLGFEYKTQVYVLAQFDRVVHQEMTAPGPVTRQVVEAYLGAMAALRPLTRRVRLSVIRQFLIYLWRLEPRTYVPERSLLPVGAEPTPPHIYTEEEIRALMTQALRYPVRYPSRRWGLYHTLIGFLYATGLRISEALALSLGDVDFEQSVIHIRKTKFHKSRLVPLASSTCVALRQYLAERADRGHPTAPSSSVFTSHAGTPLPYSTACQVFQKIVALAGLRGADGRRTPRLHDLRHTAAVRRLYLWYCEGKDVNALLPFLVTYLGHSAVSSTQTYLTATAALLEQASMRFESQFPLDASTAGSMS